MKRHVTIHDVSNLAGVSLSTVSRVLNDHATVNPPMRERVLQAVQNLGYRPNLAARTLKTSRSHLLVFMIPEISNPYYTETYRGIHAVADKRGYVTLIYEAVDVNAAVRTILTRGADGVVIDAFCCKESKDRFMAAGIPFVQTNAPATLRTEESSVRIDVYGAAIEALEYLWSMGHRRIGLIDSDLGRQFPMDERERAFRRFAADRGIEDPGRFVVSSVGVEGKYGGGFSGMKRLLARGTGVTAIITLNDLVAIGAIAGARSLGLTVPHDISVVGFDNAEASRYSNPPLTTVSIPTVRQGEIAATMLFDLFDNPNEQRYSVQLHTELVVRDSVIRRSE